MTHGIDESVYRAERVVVMTYRPGMVKRIVEIRLPRPRDPASPAFAAVLRGLTALVREEQLRHERDDSSPVAI